MYLVCGEALFDVFATPAGSRSNRLNLEAVAGGSPFNVAVGLARLGTPSALFAGISNDHLGQQLRQVLDDEGVDGRYLVTFDAPTTLAIVALGAGGVPIYSFRGEGYADRLPCIEHLAPLGEEVRGIHVGSYSLVTTPIADTLLGVFSELRSITPMLERSRYGIEFRGPHTIAQATRLMQQIADSRGATRLGYFLIMLELLAGCDDYQLLSGATSAQLGDEHHADRTNMAVNYIFDNYMRELPLEEVAGHLGMKPTYFSRFFKRATGRCYVEFVNSLRISKSCELLLDNDKPVTDICFESGFNNLSNFNRRFQQLKGMTPSCYRRLVEQRLTEQNLAG